MLRIYPSSRYTRAQMWIDLAKEYRLHYTAQWIKHVEYKDMTDLPDKAKKYWQANLRDVKDCDLLIAFGDYDDVLGGTLIELGAALAYNKRVFLVGQNEAFRCWRHHPLVTEYTDMNEAMDRVRHIEIWGCEI